MNSAMSFIYSSVFLICLSASEKYLVLEEQNEGVLFILYSHMELVGNIVTVSCIGLCSSKVGDYYGLSAKSNRGSYLRLQSYAKITQDQVEAQHMEKWYLSYIHVEGGKHAAVLGRDGTKPEAEFDIPNLILEQIYCKMSCIEGKKNIDVKEISESVLTMLSSYSFSAQLVMTIAAFATKYGDDFWVCADDQNRLLKHGHVTRLVQRRQIENKQESLSSLHGLITIIMQVIEYMMKVDQMLTKLQSGSNNQDLSLVDMKKAISSFVLNTTEGIMVCTTRFTSLLSNDHGALQLTVSMSSCTHSQE
ncbi:E3 ubiquitin-protein ligase [Quillaja saponaria]|uniref:E3 ubiquitin-protein ligase n=1 Tax=Quillaja saponaria TaxID=32244 RepID=A0AAD7QIH6_QUISA|nr:E3 ubiquitin-protein ligase [Quillaja saponaria]